MLGLQQLVTTRSLTLLAKHSISSVTLSVTHSLTNTGLVYISRIRIISDITNSFHIINSIQDTTNWIIDMYISWILDK